MQNRWIILFVLFFARMTMAFQYQSVAALSPVMLNSLAITLVDIGLLIGLYFGPGVIVSLMGGTIATWVGDKRTVILSLVLMIAGGTLMAVGTSTTGLLAGRAIAGIGGVVTNVLLTKLVIDWFSGRNLGTAMAIFLNSWPLGIALAVLILPTFAALGGLTLAWVSIVAMAIFSLLLFAPIYRAPDDAQASSEPLNLTTLPWVPLLMASAIWGFYNAGISMVFGFGPTMLAERGVSSGVASTTIGLFMIAIAVGAPVGGWLADMTKRGDGIILTALMFGVAAVPALIYVPNAYIWLAYGMVGFLVGLSPGLIVSLPSRFLLPEARVFGMGVFFAGYYLCMAVAPPIAAALANWVGRVEYAFVLGGAFLTVALGLFLLYRYAQQVHQERPD